MCNIVDNNKKKKELRMKQEEAIIVHEVIVEPQPVVHLNGEIINTNERAEFINN